MEVCNIIPKARVGCVPPNRSAPSSSNCSSTSPTPRASCHDSATRPGDALRERILGFLRGTLIPHAKAEEQVLYPEWATLLRFPDAAAPMIHDHEAIVARIERLERADVHDVDSLQGTPVRRPPTRQAK